MSFAEQKEKGFMKIPRWMPWQDKLALIVLKAGFFLFLLLLILVLMPKVFAACIVPTDAMNVVGSPTFCGGVYKFNGTGDGKSVLHTYTANQVINLNGSIFIGNYSSGLTGSTRGFYIDTSGNNIIIKNGVFRNYKNCLYVANTKNVTFINVSCFNNDRSIFDKVYFLSIFKSNFTNVTTRALQFSATATTNTSNLNISKNIFRNGSNNNFASILILKTSRSFNNTFSGNSFTGAGFEIYNTNNSKIINNVWRNAISTQKGIYINNSWSINISKNFFKNDRTLLYDIWLSNGGRHTISYNNFTNTSNNAPLLIDGKYNLVFNNSFDIVDKAILIQGDNNKIYYNKINNSYTGFDGYNLAILVDIGDKKSAIKNNSIYNNSIYNAGNYGILYRKVNGLTIKYNYIDVMTRNKFNSYTGQDSGDIPCYIGGLELYKTWLGDNSESSTDNRTSKMFLYNSSNVIISGNTLTNNVACIFRNQGGVNITHDFTNYWFRSFQFPEHLVDRDKIYFSNNYQFFTLKRGSNVLVNHSGQGYMGSITRDYSKFSFFNGQYRYEYYNNTNKTHAVKLNLFNLTNALVYWNNGSVIGSKSINNNDGSVNLTLPPKNYTYILNNYNQTEGIIRPHDRLSFTSSSTSTLKKIASNLSQPINATVVFSVSSCNIASMTYTTHSQDRSYNVLNQPGYTCTGNPGTVSVTLYDIEPASGSNQIAITYSDSGGPGGGGAVSGTTVSTTILSETTIVSGSNQTLKIVPYIQDKLGDLKEQLTENKGKNPTAITLIISVIIIVILILITTAIRISGGKQ